MSKIARMMQQATAGAGGAGLDVDEVFSTFIYNGTGGNATITNGIDLSGEGGLVITKRRTNSYNWGWFDTVRGVNKALHSNDQDPEETLSNNGVTAFNSNGFSIGDQAIVNSYSSSDEIASWTFRKAPSFFDIQTYTGDGSYMYVSHNLGSTPGMIIVKSRDSQSDGDATSWHVWHRSAGTKRLYLNDDTYNAGGHRIDAIGSSSFRVGGEINNNGKDYVAYIFAHNNNDGGFGPSSDQDIIKCGSYTGNDSDSTRIDVNLGFEPQFLLIKNAASIDRNWTIVDSIRGLKYGYVGSGARTTDRSLAPNLQSNEETCSTSTVVTRVDPTPTGFAIRGKSGTCNELGNHIYVAIRRGSLVTPTDATKVFSSTAYSGNGTAGRVISSNTVPVVDLAIVQPRAAAGDNNSVVDRIRGNNLLFNTQNPHPELTNNTNSISGIDLMSGIEVGTDTRTNWSSGTYIAWFWKRAVSYFDIVPYTGTASNRTITHNLGVEPEMMWIRRRDGNNSEWIVYHKDAWDNTQSHSGNSKIYELSSDSNTFAAGILNYTAPTSSVFSVGTSSRVNGSGSEYICYLWSSLSGISKCGSYTGNGSTQNIDCGFSSGARFVLIKCSSDGLTDWHVMDSTRGIVSGNDPFLYLNSNAAEDTGEDMIDPNSSGFSLAANNRVNQSGRAYFFYAVA